MSRAIELTGVRKTFGPKVAVDALDLTVPEGALYGFIGPNGAGKTTAIRMIMSILFPDAGEISVLGRRSALDAKDRIGYLPEERGLYKKMRVGSFLEHMGLLKGLPKSGLRGRVRDWLARVGLADVERRRCEELSKGMQQKVQFISAVIHEPELLILDEPFSGLDPVNMRLLRDLFREQQRRGATIVFSTHVMYQAEQLCDHIIMIDDGRKVLDDSLAAIRSRHTPRALLLEPLSPDANLAPLRELHHFSEVLPENGSVRLVFAEGCAPQDAMRAALASVPASRIEIHRPTLEDIFVEIAGHAIERPDARLAPGADA